jgi:glycerol uptake facilitator-like aquaporin
MTIGAWATRKISAMYAVGYVGAQVLGATIAWLVLDTFIKGSSAATATGGSSLFHAATLTGGKEWYIFFAELLGATILAFGLASALNMMKREKIAAAFSYGLATLIALLIAGSVTSMFLTESNTGLTFLNPATAIAANGLSWNLWPISIYIVAPILGSIIGFVLQDFLKTQENE